MNFKQSFTLAIKSIMGNKMRAFLTMLGIIIGVAAVIVLVSLVDGYAKSITSRFESMGANLINVTIQGRNSNRKISPDDMQALVDKNSASLQAMAPSVQIQNATIKNGNLNETTTALGTNENYALVNNKSIQYGRFIDYMDVEKRQKVAVIGPYTANYLYGTPAPLGQNIKVNGEVFTIIGVTEARQSSQQGSEDDRVIIPYNIATRLGSNSFVGSYAFRAVSKDTVDAGVLALNELLQNKFPTTGNSSSYRVFNMADMLNQINEVTKSMSAMLGGIAGISLLVGGIGIMNIMLVSVTERIKEIGVRKALGAKRRDILSQFITEAAVTSSLGGVLGILLGVGLTYALGPVMNLVMTPVTNSIFLAFGISVAIGIVFGFLPADKAAKLNPIEALRYE